jgi:hypothetical protein
VTARRPPRIRPDEIPAAVEATQLVDEPKPNEFAHPSLVIDTPDRKAVERVFRAYWLPLLTEGGKISIEKLKGELYDAWFLVNEARRVYRHVTGGVTDDLTASADGIIAMAERQVDKRLQALREELTRG